MTAITRIGPAEYVGEADVSPDGTLRIGDGIGVVTINASWIRSVHPTGPDTVSVYVRRTGEGDIAEVAMAGHDGLAVEAEEHVR